MTQTLRLFLAAMLLAACAQDDAGIGDDPVVATAEQAATAPRTTNTTDLVQGITTKVDDVYAYTGKPASEPKVPLETSVRKVSYSAPELVTRGGTQVWEVTGTITGVGWGGYAELVEDDGFVSFTGLNTAHYDYEVTFALRWSRNWNGVLDVYNHGFWNFAIVPTVVGLAGPAGLDDLLHVEREGDELVGNAMTGPRHDHAFFTWNAFLRADGTAAQVSSEGLYRGRPLGSGGDTPIARDVARVAKRLVAKLARKPVVVTLGMGHSFGATRLRNANLGTAPLMSRYARATLSFSRPAGGPAGVIAAGTPFATDAGVAFLTTSSVSFAAGARGPLTVVAEASLPGSGSNVAARTLRGVVPLFDATLLVSNLAAASGGSDVTPRTGDVYERAYDATSPRIWDGLVLFATGCTTSDLDPIRANACAVDARRKMQIPMTVIAGQLESGAAGHSELRLATLLAGAGADVARDLRIYQVRNLPHNWDEVWHATPAIEAGLGLLGLGSAASAGRMGPVVAGLVDNMVDHVREGRALLPSRIDGFVTRRDGRTVISYVQFDRTRGPLAVGGVTSVTPFADDPAIDFVEPSLQTDTAALVPMLQAAQAAMPTLPLPIFLPETSCRAGALTLPDDDGSAYYQPFDAEIFTDIWGSEASYRRCLSLAGDVLALQGLYDR